MRQSKILLNSLATAWLVFSAGMSSPVAAQAAPLPISETPLYLAQALPPLNMLVMGKDHKNYYEAYNDASDLNGDGIIDVGFKPDVIDYYGYFNSRVCYVWNSSSLRFDPAAGGSGSRNKQCTGSGHWSGDFLNYLTTGRFDALRKVLYGGWRQVDSTTETVLQGAFFPQDGHSWGKEYKSTARDGFDISRYAPLSQPADNRYHQFAVTTVTDNSAPMLRVMQDSPYRIWNWVSIEGPVAGTRCFNSTNNRVDCISGGTTQPHPGHPNNRAEFSTIETNYATATNQIGTLFTRDRVDCNSGSSGPCQLGLSTGQQDNYLTIINGTFRTSATGNGNYQFRVDGDDAIDVEIRVGDSAGVLVAQAGCYGGRGFGACGGAELTPTVALTADTTYWFKFRQEEAGGGDGYLFQFQKTSQPTGSAPTFGWRTVRSTTAGGDNGNIAATSAFSFRYYNLTPSTTASSRQDYLVRVLACPSTAALREDNCKAYGSGSSTVYKPTGILHDFGETNRMYFGLLTGSQRNNLEGGVLRRNISSFANEVNATTGQFITSVDGIVRTLDRFRMIGGAYGGGTTNNLTNDSNWAWGGGTGNCPSIGNRAINNGECRMWGNPIGEMMFETLRYYAGAAAPTVAYASGGATQGVTEETTLGLTTPAWQNPYAATPAGLGFRACAKPVMTVISDINPSYDSDLPGNAWGTPTFVLPTEISDFSLETQGQKIWNEEFGAGGRSVFIGQSGTGAGSTDGAPTLKSASSFGTIRGLSPEEPTKGGSFSSSAVANYGWTKTGRINALSTEKVRTYAVALASPLPVIQFAVGGRQMTFVPFAKTAGGTFADTPGQTQFATNTIVDFYIEEFVNLPGQEQDANINQGRPYAAFRINFEDVEQGNDHDMDAIVRYEFRANADGTVTVTLNSEYAAGSARQNMGYIASGTTADGVYLEVRDFDTSEANAPAYIFNTPPGRSAGYCNVSTMPTDCRVLPLNTVRTFTPGTTNASATAIKDPLWYAAKFGGFNDSNNNARPDLASEWDSNADGKPDNYFLVTNALTLKEELTKAFSQIERDSRPSGGVAASGARRDGEFLAFVPEYNAEDWTGDVKAYNIRADGNLGTEVWSADQRLPAHGARTMFAMVREGTALVPRPFTVTGLGGTLVAPAALGLTTLGITTTYGATTTIADVVDYLRGNSAKEVRNAGGVFRDRSRRIGDILGSQPEVLSRGTQGYTQLPAAMGGGATGAGTYGNFVVNTKATRVPVVFVGSNDGFLHAFDARSGTTGGTELFAIAPNSTLSKMGRLAAPNYAHTYYIDASPAQGDAFLGGQWKSIVLASTGVGGKSVLILDATNPAASFTASNILYEVEDAGLGQSLGRGQVILAEDDKWYAVFGNGLNNSLNQSGIILVDLATGAVRRIMTGLGTAADTNGMGALAVVDADGDLKVDTIYGGDYHGRMWKFDLSASNPTSWAVAYSGQPLFVATSNAGARQIFTGSIDVARHFQRGFMVLSGTGRYLLTGDGVVGTNPPIDTFYGIWDNLDAAITATPGRSALQAQTIVSQETTSLGLSRSTSRNTVNFATQRGWFLDLRVGTEATAAVGERFIGEPRVLLGRVLFTTFTPIGDECAPGGTNWLYSLGAVSGEPRLAGTGDTGVGNAGAVALNQGGSTSPPAVAPPVVLTPPAPRPEIPPNDGGGDDQPPPCTGSDCPPPPPPPTPPATSVRDRQCISNLGVLTSTGIRNFSNISCGRQSWRQID